MTAGRGIPQGKNAKANLDIKVRLHDIYGFNIDKIIKGMLLACRDPETSNAGGLDQKKQIVKQSFLASIEKNNQLSKGDEQVLITFIDELASRCSAAYIKNRVLQLDGKYSEALSMDDLVKKIKKEYVEDYSFEGEYSIQRKFFDSIISQVEPDPFLGKLQGYSKNDAKFLRSALHVHCRTVVKDVDTEYSVTKTTKRFETVMGDNNFLQKNIFPAINALLTTHPQHKNLLLLKHAIAVIPGIYEDKHPSGFVSLYISDKSPKRIVELKQLADSAMSINCFDKNDSNDTDIKQLLSQPTERAVDQIVDLLVKRLMEWEAIAKVPSSINATKLYAMYGIPGTGNKEYFMKEGTPDEKKAISALEKMDKSLLVKTGDHHLARLLMVVLCEAYHKGMISEEKWEKVPAPIDCFYKCHVSDAAEEKNKKRYSEIKNLYPELQVILGSMVNQNLKKAQTLEVDEAPAPATTAAAANATAAPAAAASAELTSGAGNGKLSAAPHVTQFRGPTTSPAAGGPSVSQSIVDNRRHKPK
jgi:hypothetical protein